MNSSLGGAGAALIGIAVYNTLNLWAPTAWTYTKGLVVGAIGITFCILAGLV